MWSSRAKKYLFWLTGSKSSSLYTSLGRPPQPQLARMFCTPSKLTIYSARYPRHFIKKFNVLYFLTKEMGRGASGRPYVLYVHTYNTVLVCTVPQGSPLLTSGTPERKLPDRVIYRPEADGGATHRHGAL